MTPHRDQAEVWHRYAVEAASFLDIDARIHVWRIGLDGVHDRIGDTLSDDERLRADRLRRPEDRRRFIAARGVLRTILADVLDETDASKARSLRFAYGPAGKPSLIDDPDLRFNLSHSEDLAVIAVTRSGEVGIDVERRRRAADMESIAGIAFTEGERNALLGCPADDRESVFYRIWTRKEALLKAMGSGLPALIDSQAPSFAQAATAWLVTTLPHLDGYVASLARPRAAHGLKLWSWPDAANMRSQERRARPRPTIGPRNSSPHPFEIHR